MWFSLRSRISPALLAAALLALGHGAAHAVSVSPAALYIDHRSRTGSLTLYNAGTLPEEIEIGFAFGYPTSDAKGNVSVALLDSVPAGEPSAVAWLRAFPRRLVLQPGERQVVRVMVQPPAGLDDGEYWGRVLVRSRGGQPPVEQTSGDVRVQINVETVVVTALSYRKGEVRTGLSLGGAVARSTPEGVALSVSMERQGNAAFLGRLRATVLDASGNTIAEAEDPIAVYRAMRRRVVIPIPAGRRLRPGAQVRVTVDTERPDLPSEGPLPAPVLSQTIPVG